MSFLHVFSPWEGGKNQQLVFGICGKREYQHLSCSINCLWDTIIGISEDDDFDQIKNAIVFGSISFFMQNFQCFDWFLLRYAVQHFHFFFFFLPKLEFALVLVFSKYQLSSIWSRKVVSTPVCRGASFRSRCTNIPLAEHVCSGRSNLCWCFLGNLPAREPHLQANIRKKHKQIQHHWHTTKGYDHWAPILFFGGMLFWNLRW